MCRRVGNSTDLTQTDNNLYTDSHFTIPPITSEYVEKEISSMSPSKATGLDGISVKVLKLASTIISPSLTWIMNLSLQTGKVPKDWKLAKVCPIF